MCLSVRTGPYDKHKSTIISLTVPYLKKKVFHLNNSKALKKRFDFIYIQYCLLFLALGKAPGKAKL